MTMQEIESSLIRDGVQTVVELPKAASILRVAQSTLRAYRDAGHLRSVYPRGSGRQIMFLRAELARYMAEEGIAS